MFMVVWTRIDISSSIQDEKVCISLHANAIQKKKKRKESH